MEKFTKYVPIATFALVVVIALMLVGGNSQSVLGASGTRFPNGLSADSTSPSAGEVRGTTLTITGAVSGGAATVSSLTSTGATVVGLFTQGGCITSTTTLATATTLTASNIETCNVLDVTIGGASLTATLPASSTLSLIQTAGQTRTLFIRNATTTAGLVLTLASGTGINLKTASTTATIESVAAGTVYGKIDFLRRTDTSVDALLTVFNN